MDPLTNFVVSGIVANFDFGAVPNGREHAAEVLLKFPVKANAGNRDNAVIFLIIELPARRWGHFADVLLFPHFIERPVIVIWPAKRLLDLPASVRGLQTAASVTWWV